MVSEPVRVRFIRELLDQYRIAIAHEDDFDVLMGELEVFRILEQEAARIKVLMETRAVSLRQQPVPAEPERPDVPQPPIRHALMWDHPTALSRWWGPTECSLSVPRGHIAATLDQVTCPECLRALQHAEELEL